MSLFAGGTTGFIGGSTGNNTGNAINIQFYSSSTSSINTPSITNPYVNSYYYNNNGTITSSPNQLPIAIQQGPFELKLPDGSVLKIDSSGNYKIEDKNAKITYRANNIREFNRFLNASDLIESFIKDLGVVGVKQDQVLNIPIELFINWLIIKSAEQDGENPPDVPKLEIKLKPRCKHCGRFMTKNREKIGFCNVDHFSKYENKVLQS
jgi:hypothetical protein